MAVPTKSMLGTVGNQLKSHQHDNSGTNNVGPTSKNCNHHNVTDITYVTLLT